MGYACEGRGPSASKGDRPARLLFLRGVLYDLSWSRAILVETTLGLATEIPVSPLCSVEGLGRTDNLSEFIGAYSELTIWAGQVVRIEEWDGGEQ